MEINLRDIIKTWLEQKSIPYGSSESCCKNYECIQLKLISESTGDITISVAIDHVKAYSYERNPDESPKFYPSDPKFFEKLEEYLWERR